MASEPASGPAGPAVRGATARLLLSCPDQRGLVARVADFVWRHGGDITHADQHTDEQAGIFFQRIELRLAGFELSRPELCAQFGALASELGMAWRLRYSDEVRRMAVLVSGQAHCLYDLLARWRAGELPGEIVVVISNRADHAGAARHFGVPFHQLPQVERDPALLGLLASYRAELVVLARYMQILSPAVIEAFRDRVINIHHSFLPAFAGGRAYLQAHTRGVKLIGATSHYATEDLDEGPIIAQDVARASHRDSVEDLARRGRDLEIAVLARAVHAHLTDRVLVYGRKTVVFD